MLPLLLLLPACEGAGAGRRCCLPAKALALAALLRPRASPVASLRNTIAIRAPNHYELQLVFCGSTTRVVPTGRRATLPLGTRGGTLTPPPRAAATREEAYVARELEPVWCTLSEISALLTVTMPSPSRSSAQVDSAGPARAAPSSASSLSARGSNSQRVQIAPCFGPNLH